MENERIKVYVGRRSMCAGDDMNAPNMKCFYLPDSLDEFAAKLDQILPFDNWICYLGYPIENVTGEEDGIIVGSKKNDSILISYVLCGSDAGACNEKYTIVQHAENWHELVKANPYLFCE